MAVVIAEDITLSWGDRHVLQGMDLRVGERERVGLVGPNGCGKSTLMSILADKQRADSGSFRINGRVAFLDQDPTFEGEVIEDVVRVALAWHGDLVAAYDQALADDDLDRAGTLQAQLDDAGWSVDHKIDAILDAVGAPPKTRSLEGLSGGEKRRLALAATLLAQPDVLLLDEPTNHLDARTIAWLEKFLQGYRGAVVLVTHDRYLLEAVAERIVEIEHGVGVSYDGSYADYLIARAERHAVMHRTEERRLRILARESEWASRSPAARTGKQKARLNRLEVLREVNKLPEDRSFELDFSTGLKTSGTLIEAHELIVDIAGMRLVDGLELAVRPGERIGIVGDNGAGKSTLLKALIGTLTPVQGVIHKAPRVKIGMLDQNRTGLKPDDTVFEAAGGGNDRVMVGEHWVHVATFLGRLLFRREQFDARVSGLSGGERARLLLARKMLEGNALLLLDEPTNDLDLWTLRVLEEALLGFDGAALIVTHDRAFLDRVCTAVLAFEGDGVVVRYADRLQAERAAKEADAAKAAKAEKVPEKKVAKATPAAPAKPKTRLSYKEKQELEALPDQIDALETELGEVEGILGDPATYKDRADEVAALTARSEALPAQIEALFERWEALSERA